MARDQYYGYPQLQDEENSILIMIWGQLFRMNNGGSAFNPAAFAAYLATLPTSDPHVLGAPWNNGGFLAISTG